MQRRLTAHLLCIQIEFTPNRPGEVDTTAVGEPHEIDNAVRKLLAQVLEIFRIPVAQPRRAFIVAFPLKDLGQLAYLADLKMISLSSLK